MTNRQLERGSKNETERSPPLSQHYQCSVKNKNRFCFLLFACHPSQSAPPVGQTDSFLNDQRVSGERTRPMFHQKVGPSEACLCLQQNTNCVWYLRVDKKGNILLASAVTLSLFISLRPKGERGRGREREFLD